MSEDTTNEVETETGTALIDAPETTEVPETPVEEADGSASVSVPKKNKGKKAKPSASEDTPPETNVVDEEPLGAPPLGYGQDEATEPEEPEFVRDKFYMNDQEFDSPDDAKAAAIAYMEKHPNETIMVSPEVLLGFTVGGPVDFKAHQAIGLRHPKTDWYYNLETRNVAKEGKPEDFRYYGDAKFIELFTNIRANAQLNEHDPILVYPIDNEIGILNGATRASIVGYVINDEPEKFLKVPIKPFNGSIEKARGVMISTNDGGNFRTLTPYEKMEAIFHLKEDNPNMTDADVCVALGQDPSTYQPTISLMRKVRSKASADMLKQFEIGNTNFNVLKQMIDENMPKKKQAEIAERIANGEKVTAKTVKGEGDGSGAAKRKIRPMGKINAIAEFIEGDLIAHLKENRKYSGAKDVIDEFLAAHTKFATEIKAIYDELNGKDEK